MNELAKEALKQLTTTPLIFMVLICTCAVWYLYSDLSSFIQQQQQVLTQQVKQQQETTDLLNQIAQRIRDIEMKIFDKNTSKSTE